MEHEQRRAQRAKLMRELDKDRSVERPTEYASAEAGREALERGLEQWREEIIEPKGEVNDGPILERYIQEGAGWSWVKSYKNRKKLFYLYFGLFFFQLLLR